MPLGNNIESYFKVGSQIGKANAPSEAGPANIMSMFKNVAENNMKLQQTAALFKGEKQWEFANDPSKQAAQADFDAKADNSGMSSGINTGADPTDNSFTGGTPRQKSNAQPASSNGSLIQKSAAGFGGNDYINPEVPAAEQKVKDTLQGNQHFNAAMNMVRNMYGPMAGMHKQQGGGGLLPGILGQVTQKMGSVPNTDAMGRFDVASKDLAANTAQQWSGNRGGIARLVDFFNSGGLPTRGQSEENNLAILQQQAINNWGLMKAHANSGYASVPTKQLDENQISELISAAKNPAMVSPEERNAINRIVGEEYQQAKQGVDADVNPFAKAVSGIASKVPYSGFNPIQKAAANSKVTPEMALEELRKRKAKV